MRPLSTLDRRTVLKVLSIVPASLALPKVVIAQVKSAGLISTDVCLLTPETTEGPFYVDPDLIRTDITEDKPGLPMVLRLQVVSPDCAPIPGARVDVWHCDAGGVYSGVENLGGGEDATGLTFLRGTQPTDSTGIATFHTIFPGWYRGRTTHIHYKVFLDDKTVLTSQIFFDEKVNAMVYDDHADYADRGPSRDTFNADDGIAQEAGDGAYCTIRLPEPDGDMEASLVVGVNPAGGSAGLLDWLWRRS